MSEKGLAPQYDPRPVEHKWYSFWLKNDLFRANPDTGRPPFTIVIPPPNVTGILHIGHILNNTVQDILIRWKRMQGYEALWMPGTDHAGIATQVVVEKMLAGRGIQKKEIGRDRFIREVWEWREQYGGTIIEQLKRLGASCDWPRERFTMDEGLSKAVLKVFVELYDKGIIYRGYRIINWCPRCNTALSNEEAIPREENGSLWVIDYPLKDGTGKVSIATTRPETMLGDTGVAVHPDDPRYTGLIGKTLELPLVGREIPVVGDAELVDPEFGTGAVKVTPAHDPNDFVMGQKHNLPQILIMDELGKMNENAGTDYEGMERFEAREKIVKDLEEKGLIVRVEHHTHAVPHCQRCDTILEPYLSRQWFARMKPLADRLLKALDADGIPSFTPEHWVKTYRHWLENIEDWCISRQLWWGHRIPVWYCDDCDHVYVGTDRRTDCPECNSRNIRQDEDVLDTWFSSALWPFSTMGWPEETEDLKYFYPTSVLVTGHDILFFWVARMMMMGYELMGERPFDDVYLTSLVRDAKGRKLSKSLGNSPDPIHIMDTYGSDGLRMAMMLMAPHGQDILYADERMETGRNFANKLWNAARFVLMHQEEKFSAIHSSSELSDRWDCWILHRLGQTIQNVTEALDRYAFHETARLLYDFLWHDFCDWYLEVIKPRLFNESDMESRDDARRVSLHVLEQTLRLLHPIMPFISEEIWQQLRNYFKTEGAQISIMKCEWPTDTGNIANEIAEGEIRLLQQLTGAIREVRADFSVPPSKRMQVICHVPDPEMRTLIMDAESNLSNLATAEISIEQNGAKNERPPLSAAGILHGMEFFVPLADLIDVTVESARLTKERDRVTREVRKVEGRLSNEKFVSKAPEEVVAKEKDKQKRYEDLLERLERNLSVIQETE